MKLVNVFAVGKKRKLCSRFHKSDRTAAFRRGPIRNPGIGLGRRTTSKKDGSSRGKAAAERHPLESGCWARESWGTDEERRGRRGSEKIDGQICKLERLGGKIQRKEAEGRKFSMKRAKRRKSHIMLLEKRRTAKTIRIRRTNFGEPKKKGAGAAGRLEKRTT